MRPITMTNSSSPPGHHSSPHTPVHPSSDASYFDYRVSDRYSEYIVPELSSFPTSSFGSQESSGSDPCEESTNTKVDIGATRKRIQAHQQVGSGEDAACMEIDELSEPGGVLQDRLNSPSAVRIVQRTPQTGKENAYNHLENDSGASSNKSDLRRRHTDFGFQPYKRSKHNEPPMAPPRKAASLRRADSLRADAKRLPPLPQDLVIPPFITIEEEDELVKTIAAVTARPHPHRLIDRVEARKIPASPQTPILSTLQDHIPVFPHSEEAISKLRLQRLKERESAIREREGLSPEAIRDLECVDEERESPASSSTGSQDTQSSVGEAASRFSVHESWADAIGLHGGVRNEIVHWLLRLSRDRLVEKYQFDLAEHLKNSPETHFHAVHMFLRYFYILTSKNPGGNGSPHGELRTSHDCLAGWDIALGCLALSVKLHRDTLWPLYPISTDDFLIIAPHALEFDDIERAQYDIMTTLSHTLGATPELILGELWTALPSLRLLLSFPNGWSITQRETWWLLYKATTDPAVLRFPLTVFTASALCEALIITFKNKYQFEGLHPEEWRRDATRGKKDYERLSSGIRLKRAREEAEGVVMDVQEALGVSDGELFACRLWLSLL